MHYQLSGRVSAMGAAVAAALITTSAAFSGSLTPPPGAPASTMKTLSDVEPRTAIRAADLPLTISAPGSFYLAESISFATTEVNGITVNSPNVTIDLNGFTLTGPGQAAGLNGTGIYINPGSTQCYVRNGTVTKWKLNGIVCAGERGACTDVTVTECGGRGLVLEGVNSRADRCVAVSNSQFGIWLIGSRAKVTNCVSNNNGVGIRIDGCEAVLLENNQCVSNTSYGMEGQLVTYSKIISNTFARNGANVYFPNGAGCLFYSNSSQAPLAGFHYNIAGSHPYATIVGVGAGWGSGTAWLNIQF